MPKKARANYFNFSGGLNTDASPLNRSPVTVTATDNCTINLDGSIQSRRGFELLSALVDVSLPKNDWPIDIELLDDIYLLKMGQHYKFWKSSNVEDIDATPNHTASALYDQNNIAASGKYVFAVSQNTSGSITFPTIRVFDKNDGSTVLNSNVYVRVDVAATVGGSNASRPATTEWTAGATTLGTHPYNTGQTVWTSGSYTNTADYNFETSYTSGNNVVVAKGVVNIVTGFVDGTKTYSYDTSDWETITVGKPLKIITKEGVFYDRIQETYSSGGNYVTILENLSPTEGLVSLTSSEIRKLGGNLTVNVSQNLHPDCVAVGLGRVIMAKNDTVYYSQIFTNDISNAANFHTAANKFDPLDNEVVDSDGGFFTVAGANRIIRIIESKGSIVIFADNGVWEAAGSGGVFLPTDFVVRRISNKGIVGDRALAIMEDGVAYLAKDGVNLVVKDPNSGLFMITQSITDNRISEKIIGIADGIKEVSRLCYNDVDKELYLLYGTTTYEYNKILVFKLKLPAWYEYSITGDSDTDLTIANIFMGEYEGDRVPIVLYQIETASYQEITYGRLYSTEEYDFPGTTYAEYNIGSFSSAHQTHGDLMRGKSNNYIKVLYESVETATEDDHEWSVPLGGCKLRGSIDFANDPVETTDSFGQPFNSNVAYGKYYEIYPTEETGFSHHTYKHKLLGRGNVLQYHFKNYLIERWWVAAQNSTGESPILDDGTYWTETTEAAYIADGGGVEWAVGSSYTTGDYVKTTKITHFKIVGWASELIPTEGVTTR